MAVNASSYPRRLAPSPQSRNPAPTSTTATSAPPIQRGRARVAGGDVRSGRTRTVVAMPGLSSARGETGVSPR